MVVEVEVNPVSLKNLLTTLEYLIEKENLKYESTKENVWRHFRGKFFSSFLFLLKFFYPFSILKLFSCRMIGK